jgi:hypothetical protein
LELRKFADDSITGQRPSVSIIASNLQCDRIDKNRCRRACIMASMWSYSAFDVALK